MTVEELIEKVDIVDYIGQYVNLELRGNEYWGCSPFSDDQTPSFSVNREKGLFYDFSSKSGFGGNVFNFIMRYHRCTKHEAFKILAQYAGVSEGCIERTGRKELSAVSVCKMFSPKRSHSKPCNITKYQYDVMERYEDSPQALEVWKREGISESTLQRFQVKYDSFMNRLIYPIKDAKGTIVNIGGRTLDPDFKKHNVRKYTYYGKWGSMNVIYGLYENHGYIVDQHEIILFEGCKSVLIADTWGIKNTAALLTSHLNEHQFRLLISLGVRVVFALDKDVNVFEDERIKTLERYTEVYYLKDFRNLLDEKDSPVDKGRETFELLYREKRRLGG